VGARTIRLIACRAGVLALLLWATQATAQPACPPPPGDATLSAVQQAVQNARDRGALWRFEKGGRHGYLYSTVHLGKLEWAPPGPIVARALREAETIAVEADLTDPAFNAAMTAPQKPDEAPVLSPSLIARLRARAAKVCAAWERLEPMPAMMTVVTLALLDAGWEGLHVDYATELVLAGFAKATSKEFVALETAAIQRAALMGGSPAEQLARIEVFVESLENGTARKEMIATANAWASGDLDALSAPLANLKPAERAALDRMVFARNPALAARIDELHRGGRRIFATAGIMHMIGDNGLPKLLAARGFKIDRVSFDDR
jgi:uncharacterized protein YbaP (TraB family)